MAEEWRPGSFTKNFSWGPSGSGLKSLYESIRVGFDFKLEAVSRSTFRSRIERLGRPDFIPINFFLFNKVQDRQNYLVVDELVFQALTARYSGQFDKLALFAFNLSRVGTWKGARNYQAEPALWSKNYIRQRVHRSLDWNASEISADDIEKYLKRSPEFIAQTTRKIATNLNYLYKVGRLSELAQERLERWWLSALFLALDRYAEQLPNETAHFDTVKLQRALAKSGFWEISGKTTNAKRISAGYFTSLYTVCGGLTRFNPESMSEREAGLIPEQRSNAEPTLEPVGVFHPSNPLARNTIPHAARVLAHYLAGFQLLEVADLDDFDVESYVQESTAAALRLLRQKRVVPRLSSSEVMDITRGE